MIARNSSLLAETLISSGRDNMLCKDDLAKVKVCEAKECTLLFLDRKHGGKRRWCSMSACGNRAKQKP
ncbi:CGNR zinc finger domain-containing protein [Hyphomicrobium sp. B1]|uniref:CGNR zinc finger domain-containing protein n=1 Tax=Hyphomicrobium sp. B1 TaxID=3075651 RepID=UPI003C2C2FE8